MLACSLQASHVPQPQEVARAGSLRLLLSHRRCHRQRWRTRHVPLMPLVQGVAEPVGSVAWPARCRVLPPLVACKASCWLSNAWAGGFHCSEMQGSRMG